jgi:hypothetical protein
MHEHFEFLARVSENAANRLLSELIDSVHSLETMPFRNPVYNRPYLPLGKYRYLMSAQRYRIVYLIENNCVYVDDIQDCRQNHEDSILKEQ